MRPAIVGLLLILISSTPSTWAVDSAATCEVLASNRGITPRDQSRFTQMCRSQAEFCRALEETAAERCGQGGQRSMNANSVLARTQLLVSQGGPSYVKSGSAANQGCAELNTIRQDQLDGCRAAHAKCEKEERAFRTSDGADIKIRCSYFGPQSNKWTQNSKSKSFLCPAIGNEIAQLTQVQAGERDQCNGYESTVKSASGQAPPQGTNAPSKEPANEGLIKKASVEARPVQSVTSDQSKRLPFPDSRACGMFGCLLNDDGTYSPIIH